MVTFNISLNKELAKVVKKMMKELKFANRSEFFRDLVRRYYLEQKAIEDGMIEEIHPSDLDCKYVDKNLDKSHYTSIENVAKELNVKL